MCVFPVFNLHTVVVITHLSPRQTTAVSFSLKDSETGIFVAARTVLKR